MAYDAKRSAGPQFSAGMLMTSAVLVGIGAALAMAGLAAGGSHVLLATRRWVRQMEVPPSEVAKAKWAQAKAAAGAGATAWQGGRPPGPEGVS